jgi:hypothetical protein
MRERKIYLRVLRRLLLNSLSAKVSWCDMVESRRLKARLSRERDLFACSQAILDWMFHDTKIKDAVNVFY